MPTHGFGSFCSATQAEGDASTIAQERRSNPALLLEVDDYVRTAVVLGSGVNAWAYLAR